MPHQADNALPACPVPPSPLLPPPPPPLPPPIPSIRDASCARVTSRWPLTPASIVSGTVIDSVGGWNGTAYGGYSTVSGALVLDGASGYVNLGTGAGGTTAFGGAMSWAFWARVDSWQDGLGTGTEMRFFDWAAGPAMDNLLVGLYSESEFINIWSGSSDGWSGSSVGYHWMIAGSLAILDLGAWYHHVLTLDGVGNIAYYVNGSLVFYGTAAAPARNVTRPNMYLGRSAWDADSLYLGAISDFQFALGTVFSAYDVANLCGQRLPAPAQSKPAPASRHADLPAQLHLPAPLRRPLLCLVRRL